MTLVEQLWAWADVDYAELMRLKESKKANSSEPYPTVQDGIDENIIKGRLGARAEDIALFMQPYIPNRVAVTLELGKRYKFITLGEDPSYNTSQIAQKIWRTMASPESTPPYVKPTKPEIPTETAERIQQMLDAGFKHPDIARLCEVDISWVRQVQHASA